MEIRAAQTLISFACVLILCVAADLHAPEVHTKLGSLRGEYVSVKGKETGVHAFLGVPFAKPPVGPALRLVPPQPVERWEGVRNATRQPPMCGQYKESTLDLLGNLGWVFEEVPDISEDCLYLNIYTPANRTRDAKLPVMVWIHGGGFTLEAASLYDGSALAAYQDVVVVLIQYRLGLMGFLSTGDEHMPGNFGLLDQVQALKWIQEHIQTFGGDPDLVTIFGESAGGISVSLLLLSPLSDGLFHRAIAQSGTAAMDGIISNNPLPVLEMMAEASGCNLNSTEKIADCIRHLDYDAVMTVAKAKFLVSVNVDGNFLTKPVEEIFHKHELLTVPFMTGVNSDEAGWLVPQFFGFSVKAEGMNREEVTKAMSFYYSDPKHEILRDLLIDEYIGTGEDLVKNREGYTDMLADVIFNIPAIRTANFHRDAGAPVYLYEYQHPPIFLQEKRPSFVGCDHGDDIYPVFGLCFTTTHVKLAYKCPEEEEELSKIVMSYWGNFARTGSPNGDGLVHWPKYGATEDYLAINLTQQVTGRQLKKDRFISLTQTLQEKVRQHKEKLERSEL